VRMSFPGSGVIMTRAGGEAEVGEPVAGDADTGDAVVVAVEVGDSELAGAVFAAAVAGAQSPRCGRAVAVFGVWRRRRQRDEHFDVVVIKSDPGVFMVSLERRECAQRASVSRSNRDSGHVEQCGSKLAGRLVAHTGFEPVLPP
jgi:hypothetical protein